jgi:hypothetical protein
MIALAEAVCEGHSDEIPKITRDHIKQVVKIPKEFREYLDKVHKRIEFSQLAVRKGLRADTILDGKGKRGGLVTMRRRKENQLDPSSD